MRSTVTESILLSPGLYLQSSLDLFALHSLQNSPDDGLPDDVSKFEVG